MKKKQPIGFFDSGIGGLSVLREAHRLLPGEDYLYFSDGKNAPYGTRPPEEVRELFLNALDFIAEQAAVKAIVVACNTATSVGIEEARRRFDFPIIGMEPAVKPALACAGGRRVLVFATLLTLKLEKFQHLVARLDPERVDYLPLQELVLLAEQFRFEAEHVLPYLQEKFAPIRWEAYGAVVLGCTHFPFFRAQIRRLLPPHVEIVDGNLGTVRNLAQKLGVTSPQKALGKTTYFLSGEKMPSETFERYFSILSDPIPVPEGGLH